MAFSPVRRHRLFAAGSACWFAALFGLSALAIRPDQLESLVGLAGSGRALPMIAPPLGMVARMLTAAAFARLGGVVGLGLGRLLAIPRMGKASRQEDSRSNDSAESVCKNPEACASGVSDERDTAAESPAIGDSPALTGPPLGKAAERLLAAELTTLSPLELVERLGIAMQCPGARGAEAAASRPFADPRAPAPSDLSRLPVRIAVKPVIAIGAGGFGRVSGAV